MKLIYNMHLLFMVLDVNPKCYNISRLVYNHVGRIYMDNVTYKEGWGSYWCISTEVIVYFYYINSTIVLAIYTFKFLLHKLHYYTYDEDCSICFAYIQ